MIAANERAYVIWQNRAFRFYLGARLLFRHQQQAAAAYCAFQCLETLLKATLVYWDKSFAPTLAGHGLAPMLRAIRNKVPGAPKVSVPQYFVAGRRFLRKH